MSDYLITMDTGEKFLAHHGVLGMKWGKWNAETAARYAGGARSNRTVKMTSKAEQHHAKVNEFRTRRDRAGAEVDRISIKKDRNPDYQYSNRQRKKYSAAKNEYIQSSDNLDKHLKKEAKYNVKAYKSDVKDAGGSPDRKTVRDLKKGRISLDDAKARTEAKVKEVLENHKDSRTNQDWDRHSNQKPTSSNGWKPLSYNKKEASEEFGEYGNTYTRSNINTYEKLASTYNRDNEKDLNKVMGLREKVIYEQEYLSYAGTKKQMAEAVGKHDAYFDWINSGSQADFEDWYDYRMW